MKAGFGFETRTGTMRISAADAPGPPSPEEIARSFEEQTDLYWRIWSLRLALQPEWQEAVVRAAITLKLCSYEPTGAIIAAMTTSIPEAPGTGRNWDYRFCWIRDAYFVIRALTSLAAGRTLEGLGIVPQAVASIVPSYLWRFRKAGQFRRRAG